MRCHRTFLYHDQPASRSASFADKAPAAKCRTIVLLFESQTMRATEKLRESNLWFVDGGFGRFVASMDGHTRVTRNALFWPLALRRPQ